MKFSLANSHLSGSTFRNPCATPGEVKNAAPCTDRNRHGASAYIGVKLPDEAGEVVVLEVLWQEVPGELRRLPDDEAAGEQQQGQCV